jgi:hypothetical protein
MKEEETMREEEAKTAEKEILHQEKEDNFNTFGFYYLGLALRPTLGNRNQMYSADGLA